MRRWEYCNILLQSVDYDLDQLGGWRLKTVNEREIPNWKKTEIFASIATYCNYMDEQGWELVSANYRDVRAVALLLFKRPYVNEIR